MLGNDLLLSCGTFLVGSLFLVSFLVFLTEKSSTVTATEGIDLDIDQHMELLQLLILSYSP